MPGILSPEGKAQKIIVALTLSTLGLVACGTGRGSTIEDCGGKGSGVVATFDKNAPDYHEYTDPSNLLDYVKKRVGDVTSEYPRHDNRIPNDPWHNDHDPADTLGEVVCRQAGKYVLSTAGQQESQLYLEQSSGQPNSAVPTTLG